MSSELNDGKNLENKFARWAKDKGFYYHRLFDARSAGGISATQPADYLVYHTHQLFYIELKSTEDGTSIAFSRFTQIKRLMECYKHGIISYFIFEFRDGIYAVETRKLYEFATTTDKKSINADDAVRLGIALQHKDDLDKLFDYDSHNAAIRS